MRRRQQPTPSSSSDSDGSDVESCFDVEDEQEEAVADTDVEVSDYDEEDLPDLEWISGEDNACPPECLQVSSRPARSGHTLKPVAEACYVVKPLIK